MQALVLECLYFPSTILEDNGYAPDTASGKIVRLVKQPAQACENPQPAKDFQLFALKDLGRAVMSLSE